MILVDYEQIRLNAARYVGRACRTVAPFEVVNHRPVSGTSWTAARQTYEIWYGITSWVFQFDYDITAALDKSYLINATVTIGNKNVSVIKVISKQSTPQYYDSSNDHLVGTVVIPYEGFITAETITISEQIRGGATTPLDPNIVVNFQGYSLGMNTSEVGTAKKQITLT